MPDFENKGTYLLMTPSEAYSLQNYKEALAKAASLCKAYKLTRILADIRGIQADISIPDRFLLGVEMAELFGRRIKLAILAPSEIIDRVGENAAVNRGGRVLVTDDLETALTWLEAASPRKKHIPDQGKNERNSTAE